MACRSQQPVGLLAARYDHSSPVPYVVPPFTPPPASQEVNLIGLWSRPLLPWLQGELSTQLGVSRSVVREALGRLASPGLIRNTRGSGTRVEGIAARFKRRYSARVTGVPSGPEETTP